MGLAEKRVMNAFQETQFEEWKRKLHAAIGTAVPIEVNWDQLMVEGSSHLYQDAWTKVYFAPLYEAFQSIAGDEMGKKALQNGLKKIVVCSTGTTKISFKDGVLNFDHPATSNIDYGKERTKTIIQEIEKAL